MAPVRGLLQNRTAAVVVVLLLSLVAVQSWLTITRPTTFRRDPVELFGLTFSIFIAVSIAFRSKFAGDRAVFGTATAALVLAGIKVTFSLSPSALLVVVTAKALLWTVAAIATVISLVRGLITPRVGS